MKKLVTIITWVALSTFITTANAAEPPVTVGVIMPLTGPYGPLGNESLAGVQVAAEVINKEGGINGLPIELIVIDDKSAPDQSVIGFKSLADKNVVGIIGSLFSNSAVATAPLAESAKIPYVGAAVADEQIYPVKDYVFISSVPMRPVSEAILNYLASEKLTKVAVVFDSKNAFSVSGWKHMQEIGPALGIEFVLAEPIASNAGDFSSVFIKMRSKSADAVMFWGIGSGAIAFTKQYSASGIKAPLVMSSAQASISRYVQPSGAAAEGVIVAALLADIGDKLPASPVKASYERISQPYKAKIGSELTGFSAGGAAAMLVMAEAVKQGGTDRQKVQQALSSLQLASPLGMHQYSATRHYGLDSKNVAITKVINGEFVPTEWSNAVLKHLGQ